MYIVMGGTGHVGSAVVAALLREKKAVTVLTRDAARAANARAAGAEVTEVDLRQVDALREVLRRGRRAFVLNPPADVTADSDAIEKRTIAGILSALEGTGLEKVVGASTGGAQPGDRLGDLSTLWTLEQGLREQAVPAAINRAAYYMSNWDGLLDTVRDSGHLPTLFPADLPIPMVSPADVGEAAAKRLMASVEDVGVQYVTGPRPYTSAEVAAVFSQRLARSVSLDVAPRDQWAAWFGRLGFSAAAAESYARMTAHCVDRGFDMPDDAWRGSTTLEAHLDAVLGRVGVQGASSFTR